MVENFEVWRAQLREPHFGSSKLCHIITFCIFNYRESFMCITLVDKKF